MNKVPTALTIAGSDPSGGAGIQADLKTFHAHGVYGMAAITLLTVQNTLGVTHVEVMKGELVREQIRAVLDDIRPLAIKTGALGNEAVIEAVTDELRSFAVPLIIDPVMISKHGAPLLPESAVEILIEKLIPLATLITPNIFEAIALSKFTSSPTQIAESESEIAALGNELLKLGSKGVLIKGGHLKGAPNDFLITAEGIGIIRGERINTTNTHGTGCTLSAAITANLALGSGLKEAVEKAKVFLEQELKNAPRLGKGVGPLAHGNRFS